MSNTDFIKLTRHVGEQGVRRIVVVRRVSVVAVQAMNNEGDLTKGPSAIHITSMQVMVVDESVATILEKLWGT